MEFRISRLFCARLAFRNDWKAIQVEADHHGTADESRAGFDENRPRGRG